MKALVVDDSVVFRMAIRQALEESSEFSKVDAVSNGEAGIKYLKENPDVNLITLDLEMPIMDGITAIKEIRNFNRDVFILVFSSFSSKGAEKTVQALSFGANDFVTKQAVGGAASIENSLKMIRESLIPVVKSFLKKGTDEKQSFGVEDIDQIISDMPIKPKLIVVGSSTGGPEALNKLFSQITAKASVPLLLVQHMPAFFTEKLASHLSSVSPVISFKEAEKGDVLEAGKCLIAPGDFHMLYKDGKIILNQDEKVCFVRPSLDVLIHSLAENYREKILSIVLTGMGNDGAASNQKLHQLGNHVFVQDEESSVIWGMPGAVKEAIPSVRCLSINDLANLVNGVFKRI